MLTVQAVAHIGSANGRTNVCRVSSCCDISVSIIIIITNTYLNRLLSSSIDVSTSSFPFLHLPVTVLPPLVMNNLEKRGTLRRFPKISLPLQTAMCGLLLVFATPMCCAIFPQKSKMLISNLEQDIQAKAKNPNGYCYFNKGL